MKGWIDYLNCFEERLLKQLAAEEIDTIEGLMALNGRDDNVPYMGKYSIPREQSKIALVGVEKTKRRISKAAGDDIKYLDYSAMLDESERAYMQGISVRDIGLKNREQNALIKISCMTMEDLCLLPAAKIFRIKGLGPQSAEHIITIRHDLYLKLKKEGIPGELRERCSDTGRLYSYIARQFGSLFNISYEEISDACRVSDRDDRILSEADGKDLSKDDYLYVISKVDTLSNRLLEALDQMIVPENSEFTWKQVMEIISSHIENEALREALEYFYKERLLRHGECFLIPRPHLSDCLSLLGADRNGQITCQRLRSRPSQDIAYEHIIAYERVRQITSNTLQTRLPRVHEDYYSSIFEYFLVPREEFYTIFPEADPLAYQYLMIRYGGNWKRKPRISKESIKNYNGMYPIEISAYITRDP